MYSEWKSLQSTIQSNSTNISVLNNFPSSVGKDVACSVVRHLASNLSVSVLGNEPSKLTNDKDVKWTMEVICHGLHLPLNEQDAIKECVNVYCDWIACLVSPKKLSIPAPLQDDPNTYSQTIIQHLYNLFIPRDEASADQVHRQALLCLRVLRTLQSTAKESHVMSRDTWETLLKFLLAVNDALLSPPTVSGDLGAQMCERIVSVLFELWLLACCRCFPAPSLWRTFRDMSQNWRHHQSLVVQWHRVNFVLTRRLLVEMYGPYYPELVVGEADASLLPADMDSDCIAQTWFRFLHVIANPCDLAKPRLIRQSTKFLRMTMNTPSGFDQSYHELLQSLPQIFFRAMKGISVLVDSFLGTPPPYKETPANVTNHQQPLNITPPLQRRSDKKISIIHPQKGGQKSLSVTRIPTNPSPNVSAGSSPAQLSMDNRQPLARTRPTVNSILHLFGGWLFEAALVDVLASLKATAADPRSSQQHQEPSPAVSFEEGRAEACGTLCRIFCAHRTGEHILPQYLARFYISLYHGLMVQEPCSDLVLASILFNSTDLLRVDLDGVMVLVPRLLTALELVLSDTGHKVKESDHIPVVELRRASIHILLSMLCLPLHYKDLAIQELFRPESTSDDSAQRTFISLKLQLTELLLRALTIESDFTNTHMLLGGLLLLVLDLANCETAESTTQQHGHDMLHSDSDLHRQHSGLTVNLEESSLKSKDFDTSYGLFGGATSLVCNRLMATWKSDLNIALSAMEVLSGLAKVKLNTPNHLMCKRTVKWICDFIVFQCSRPAPAHSKDLHSMIVAAFQCLTLWLVDHHYLLQDKECLYYVLEVVELGISGSKSRPDWRSRAPSMNRASDVPKMKAEKELMPASLRVKDAAEAVLTCIIEQVGSFPPPCGPEAPYSLLDEESLLRYCKDEEIPEYGNSFRYFVLDNSIIVSLLEQPLGNNEDPLPTVTAIIRGPFGRHAWTTQLRHLPRHHKVASKMYLTDPGRPAPHPDQASPPKTKHRCFPEMVDKIPLTKADKSIPTLDTVVTDRARHERFKRYIQEQSLSEKTAAERVLKHRQQRAYPNPDTECKQPSVSHEFQTARLFLSHYGFLTLEALKEPTNSCIPPPLAILDTTQAGLLDALHGLDSLPARTTDTAHVFYVKNGQKSAADILSNVSGHRDLDSHFMEFLLSLGWPVDVHRHPGWTGNPTTSWRVHHDEPTTTNTSGSSTSSAVLGASLFDGQNQVIYWSDISSEIVFILPSTDVSQDRRRASLDSSSTGERSPVLRHNHPVRPPKTLSLDLDAPPKHVVDKESPSTPGESLLGGVRARRQGRSTLAVSVPDWKVCIVWLESYEDADTLPLSDLLMLVPSTSGTTNDGNSSAAARDQQAIPRDQQAIPRDQQTIPRDQQNVYVIMIHKLQNSLFRINVHGPQARIGIAGPLVDGMVVSRRTMGALVRQTAINIGKRRRQQDSEAYQPPHVRRKLRIQDINTKYRSRLSEADFYTAIFQDVPT